MRNWGIGVVRNYTISRNRETRESLLWVKGTAHLPRDARLIDAAVVVTEVSPPPPGEEPIDWMLLTNEPVRNQEDAWRIVEWYERRWVVEEYHKALKTGCRIEDLQFTAVERLQPAIALLSAAAKTENTTIVPVGSSSGVAG